MTPNEIAETVRYYCKQSDLTQLELAKLAGIGKTAVFDVEKGKETMQEFKRLIPIWRTMLSESFLSPDMQKKYLALLDNRWSRFT